MYRYSQNQWIQPSATGVHVRPEQLVVAKHYALAKRKRNVSAHIWHIGILARSQNHSTASGLALFHHVSHQVDAINNFDTGGFAFKLL